MDRREAQQHIARLKEYRDSLNAAIAALELVTSKLIVLPPPRPPRSRPSPPPQAA